jgi:hypothetical protein
VCLQCRPEKADSRAGVEHEQRAVAPAHISPSRAGRFTNAPSTADRATLDETLRSQGRYTVAGISHTRESPRGGPRGFARRPWYAGCSENGA